MALGAAACGPASTPAPAPAAFRYTATADISGYYRPVEPVVLGNWSLDYLFLSQPADFQRRAEEADAGISEPVAIRFARTAGGAGETVTTRVTPTRYSVSNTAVTIEGQSPELGRVTFEGQLDQGALATARRNLGGEAAVLVGTLRVGGETAGGVRLAWWMGD